MRKGKKSETFDKSTQGDRKSFVERVNKLERLSVRTKLSPCIALHGALSFNLLQPGAIESGSQFKYAINYRSWNCWIEPHWISHRMSHVCVCVAASLAPFFQLSP